MSQILTAIHLLDKNKNNVKLSALKKQMNGILYRPEQLSRHIPKMHITG